MGELIFLYDGYSDEELRKKDIKHEYGHSIQSVKLGWLYIMAIAIPSLLVTGIEPGIAKKCYFEKWANELVKNVELKYI